jgi:hypothetical protein
VAGVSADGKRTSGWPSMATGETAVVAGAPTVVSPGGRPKQRRVRARQQRARAATVARRREREGSRLNIKAPPGVLLDRRRPLRTYQTFSAQFYHLLVPPSSRKSGFRAWCTNAAPGRWSGRHVVYAGEGRPRLPIGQIGNRKSALGNPQVWLLSIPPECAIMVSDTREAGG